jgi:quercetin dioxygenase-like cupin family protein
MTDSSYPDTITSLPRAKISLEGVQAWVAQGKDHQIVFFKIQPIGKIPPHSHAAQYGFVIEGEAYLTIDGERRHVKRGDSYHIPAGVVHEAEFLTLFRAMDYFAEPHRYETE